MRFHWAPLLEGGRIWYFYRRLCVKNILYVNLTFFRLCIINSRRRVGGANRYVLLMVPAYVKLSKTGADLSTSSFLSVLSHGVVYNIN
jgi:hypothetical protein